MVMVTREQHQLDRAIDGLRKRLTTADITELSAAADSVCDAHEALSRDPDRHEKYAGQVRDVVGALVSCLRTFRNVPQDEQDWTSIDEDALQSGFCLMEQIDTVAEREAASATLEAA